VAKAALSQEHF